MNADVDFEKLLDWEMDLAIAQRRTLGCGTDDFQMSVKVIGPLGQIVPTPLQWHNEEEKYRAMRAVSQCCRLLAAQAVVVVMDVRSMEVDAFCRHFQIEPPTRETFDTFDRERRRVMKPFGFYMGNLPPHLYRDALLAFAYGPRIKLVRCVGYRAEAGKLIFDPPIAQVKELSILMVPAWWE
jgi:hypothetical protein